MLTQQLFIFKFIAYIDIYIQCLIAWGGMSLTQFMLYLDPFMRDRKYRGFVSFVVRAAHRNTINCNPARLC